MKTFYRPVQTSIGQIHFIANTDGLLVLAWDQTIEGFKKFWRPQLTLTPHPILDQASAEVSAYTSGTLRNFNVPWQIHTGTAFQQSVWRSLLTIPFAETRSYSDIAKTLECPKAVRAIGSANGKNPLSLLLPCHRVIAKSGGLAGYAGGVTVKQKILKLEQNILN